MTRYHFANCDVEINPQDQRVITRFHDGTEVHATPQADEDSLHRARSLGYTGTDSQALWQMTRDHDLTHTLLATARGEPWSAVLHAVAHGDHLPPGQAELEERTVLFCQRLATLGLHAIAAEHQA